MFRPFRLLLATAILTWGTAAAVLAATAAGPGLITATDLLRVQVLESPALSPDGRTVAYVVRSIEPRPGSADDWEYRSHLWLAATDGSTPPRQLTRSGNNTAPAWHPDGDRLAFVRQLDGDKPQLFLLPLDGGEPRALTSLDSGASRPRWSPDGRRLLFTSSRTYAQVRDALEKAGREATPPWNRERPGRTANDTANWALKPNGPKPPAAPPLAPADPDGTLAERREWLARQEAAGNPRVTTRFNFLAETDLQPAEAFTQLYVVEAAPGAEPRPLAAGFRSLAAPEWLADGAAIVATGPRDESLHPDRERVRSLYLVDLATGDARALLARPEESYDNPTPSPDGRWLAFTVQVGGPFSFDQPKVALLPVAGGEPRILTAELDRPAQNLRWSPDSGAIYFVTASEGGFPLRRVAVAGSAVETLSTSRDWGVRDYDVAGGRLAQVVTEPANPFELHVAGADAADTRPLTTHNSAWLRDRRLAAYESLIFDTRDGLTIPFWVVKPPDFDPARKYPLLLQIHGGPAAMWGPGEASMWHEFQYYAARGYVVVFANPRGSGGYGRDFQRANYKDWGAGPAADVLTAAGYVAREPYIDPERQVVTGGSYGGYLVAWIVAHDHRFKAAVAQRGVYHLETFFGEGNAWFLVPLYFGGYPWEEAVRPILQRESPLTHVANIRTPLLIQHGDVDFRTGVRQSEMLYKSLKALERPVEYVRYPRASHEMSRTGEPRQRLDSLVRYEEFFRRHIGGE